MLGSEDLLDLLQLLIFDDETFVLLVIRIIVFPAQNGLLLYELPQFAVDFLLGLFFYGFGGVKSR